MSLEKQREANITPKPEHAVSSKVEGKEKLRVSTGSIVASIFSTFLLRLASRTSFVVLGFYLGENFESAALVGLIIEAFYVSELTLAPVVGTLSDRKGRKPYMLYAPLVGLVAAIVLGIAAFLFPRPKADVFDFNLVALLLLILVGRLLEGTANALNAPSNLGYLTDVTIGAEKMRARVLTAFQVVTVGGLALGIPFGGQVSRALGTGGFLVVILVYALTFLTIHFFMQESLSHEEQESAHGSIIESFGVVKEKKIFTFVPAWLAINTLIGAWLSLVIIILAYPTPHAGHQFDVQAFSPEARPVVSVIAQDISQFRVALAGQDADARHPNQLLYGGFSKDGATYLIGGFGLVFLIGMGLWSYYLSRVRRTGVMIASLAGLVVMLGLLSFMNSLAGNPADLSSGNLTTIYIIIPFLIICSILLSGFLPASLLHLSAISETLPGKRGAVMGLYSVLLGIGQLLGTVLGGISADLGGFYGLMVFSFILGLVALGSVLYMRSHRHDLLRTGQAAI